MTLENSAFSDDQSDDSKPRSRRRAGGKTKRPELNRSKFDQVRNRSRRFQLGDGFGELEDVDDELDDFDDYDEDEDDEENFDDLDDFGDDFEVDDEG